MRTLVLDDDVLYLTVAEGMLSALGVEQCETMSNGNNASNAMSQNQYDLVLLDLNMPDFDGLAFLRELADKKFEGSVVLVSGEQSFLLNSAKSLGSKLGLNIQAALSKPLKMNELQDCLEKVRAIPDDAADNKVISLDHTLSPKMVFQVQVHTRTKQICGAEALVRGVTDDGDIVSAGALLERYKDYEQRAALTRQLLTLFCDDVKKMREGGVKNRFSVNLDAQMLEQPEFTALIIETARSRGLSPNGVVLELTESHLPEDETRLIESIARLSMAGFEVAMDDFSTGAANFDMLRSGAFREVKLDMGLIHNARHDRVSRRFAESIVEIANTLDLRLIAEGVENQDDMVFLADMGVQYLQGFYFSKPIDADEFIDYYRLKNEPRSMAS